MSEKTSSPICIEEKKKTPIEIYNPPGLDSLAYRVGTYSSFKESMINSLPNQKQLKKLTTREDDEFVINIFDAWATVSDVLTFYQERIANEGYLRTAKERSSVLELSRTIGRELGTGVAADAFLAFEIEDAAGVIEKTNIPDGTRVQSLPAQDEKPQVFQTVEKIEARPEWNKMIPQQLKKREIIFKNGKGTIICGIPKGELKQDDLILIKKPDIHFICKIENSYPIYDSNQIQVDLECDDPEINLGKLVDFELYYFRTKCGVFGHNAPYFGSLPRKFRDETELKDWDTEGDDNSVIRLRKGSSLIFLEYAFPDIHKLTYVILKTPKYCEALEIIEVIEKTVADFLMSKRVTGISVKFLKESHPTLNEFSLRETTIYINSMQLELAEMQEDNLTKTDTIILNKNIQNLAEDQHISISDTQPNGSTIAEIKQIKTVGNLESGTILKLYNPIHNSYNVKTAIINANIALATHGETKSEILGSGDPSLTQQEFKLSMKPLTYTNSVVEGGKSSTLKVYVDEIEWTQVPNLYGHGPRERCYSVKQSEDGTTYILFGDGKRGARPPMGSENIRATYRVGLGKSGLLKQGQLKILMSQPYGVRSVQNPSPTSNAADPEDISAARENATIPIQAMKRIVSLNDVENNAKNLDVIAKAKAYADEADGKKVVRLIFALASGDDEPEPSTYEKITSQLNAVKDPSIVIVPESFSRINFDVDVTIEVADDHDPDKVAAVVRKQIESSFTFEKMQLGRKVSTEEVISVTQGVEGVSKVKVVPEVIASIATIEQTAAIVDRDLYKQVWTVRNVTVKLNE